MAGDDLYPAFNPLLRGMFGVFQPAAQAGLGTAAIWEDLRANAASWQFAAQGREQPYDPAELQEAGRAILSREGVTIQGVNIGRQLAGNWLGARQRLQALDEGAQITGSAIFSPPWATTANLNVPSRYRIRTQWQLTPANGESVSVWRSSELTTPLTTVTAALADTEPSADGAHGLEINPAGIPPELLDFEIEQI
ncbi:MAG TPA: hypothetical protein VGG07_25105 [Solirubrobacteraceae bacterium]